MKSEVPMKNGAFHGTWAWSVDQKRAAVEPEHPAIPVARQCKPLAWLAPATTTGG
jgi:hypothetical protein